MSADKDAVVRAWFRKADNDLTAAEQILRMGEPPADTICFHAQQCAEKYLKGLLTHHQRAFPRTHSLEALVALCEQAVPGITGELPAVEALSGYGADIRYPDDIYHEIPLGDAIEAVAMAKKVKQANQGRKAKV